MKGNFYYYYFYRMVRYSLHSLTGTKYGNATMIMSLFISFNAVTIRLLTKEKPEKIGKEWIIDALLVFVAACILTEILNYFLLFRKGKADKLVKHYRAIDKEKQNSFRAFTLILIYHLLSFLLCIYTCYIFHKKTQ